MCAVRRDGAGMARFAECVSIARTLFARRRSGRLQKLLLLTLLELELLELRDLGGLEAAALCGREELRRVDAHAEQHLELLLLLDLLLLELKLLDVPELVLLLGLLLLALAHGLLLLLVRRCRA